MRIRPTLTVLLVLSAFVLYACNSDKSDRITTFKKNGGWCWFQDERAILLDGYLLFGSVAHSSGFNGDFLDGDIELTMVHLDSVEAGRTITLHDALGADDHNVPALLPLPGGRLLSVYSRHGADGNIRYRFTENPFDYSLWSNERCIVRDAGITYANLHFLERENGGRGRIYNFYRGEGWNPNFIFSDDLGSSWHYGGLLILFPGRPYVKYASNGRDVIHFVTTEHHPRDYDNSIYHAYMSQGGLYKSDGTLIKNLSEGPMKPEDGTRIFAGNRENVAWTIDIQLDENEYPYIAYSTQRAQNPDHLEYRYARWDGAHWRDYFLAFAGTALYDAEADYSGLVALDPEDAGIVYIATDAHPATGEALISRADDQRHYEIFKGVTETEGMRWSWRALTEHSSADNIRPLMPESDGNYKVLLWLQGSYESYTNYNLDIVGFINP